jgi:hypothetical protein
LAPDFQFGPEALARIAEFSRARSTLHGKCSVDFDGACARLVANPTRTCGHGLSEASKPCGVARRRLVAGSDCCLLELLSQRPKRKARVSSSEIQGQGEHGAERKALALAGPKG